MNKKPILFVNDDLAEGVYAASGANTSDCWKVDVYGAHIVESDGYVEFRVDATHSAVPEHISTKTVITVEFNAPITNAKFEGFDAQVQGSRVILTRESHANGYRSGDHFNTLLNVWSPSYMTLSVISATISCTHATNVQGKYD